MNFISEFIAPQFFAVFAAFLAASFISFFIPGFLAVRKLKINLTPIAQNSLSWILGISIFILFTYILSYLGLEKIYFAVIVIAFAYSLFNKKVREEIVKNYVDVFTQNKIALFIIFAGSLLMASVMFFSSATTSAGMQFFGVNQADGIRHLAYIKSMKENFPPTHPGLSGLELRGFHYFYDFMLAKISEFFTFSVEDLNFRLFPFFISFLYGLSFYTLGAKFTKSRLSLGLILFFAYFSQSSVVFMYITGLAPSLYGDIVQPLGLIVNPFSTLSMALFAQGIALIPSVKKSWVAALAAGLILGILSEMKVYIGMIGIICVIFYSLYLLAKYKKKYFIPALILLSVTGFTTVFTFFPNNAGSGGLIPTPLLWYRHYMQTELLAPFHWEIKRQIFLSDSNYLRIVILYIQAVVVFFLINLGARILIVFKVKSLFSKKFYQNDYNLLLLISTFSLVALGSFFIQTVSPFDSVQFFWLLLPLLCIPSGIVWGEFLKKAKIVKVGILFLIIISVPSIHNYTQEYWAGSRGLTITNEKIEFLHSLKKPEKDKSIIVLPESPGFKYPKTPLVSAISGHPVYFEGGALPNDFEKVEKARKAEMEELAKAFEQCNLQKVVSISEKIDSKQIISLTPYNCFTNNPAFSKVETGDDIALYELK